MERFKLFVLRLGESKDTSVSITCLCNTREEVDAVRMSVVQSSRDLFQKAAHEAESALEVECRPLRPNVYVGNGRSLVALVRAQDRKGGFEEALRLIGGIEPATASLDEGYVLVKPNCNSHDPFPASTHPEAVRFVITKLIEAGVQKEQIIIGDMSGPAWLPTKVTMNRNGILSVAAELGVDVFFFENERWLRVKPEKANSWPKGFRITEKAYSASKVISLPCLKTHQFGGVFTLSLKNTVGMINPADRSILHKKPGHRIAEINLAYTTDLVMLDGLRCFISGGPSHGKEAAPGVVVAGSDRVAVDTIGVAVLRYYEAEGIANMKVKDHEQLKRAAEIGVGHMNADAIMLKTSNVAGDAKFDDLLSSVKDQL